MRPDMWLNKKNTFLELGPQVAQARFLSSSMLTFALLRNSSDLHIYKDLYWERNKPEKLPLNYNKIPAPLSLCAA